MPFVVLVPDSLPTLPDLQHLMLPAVPGRPYRGIVCTQVHPMETGLLEMVPAEENLSPVTGPALLPEGQVLRLYLRTADVLGILEQSNLPAPKQPPGFR
jgi:hypothetical protein